MDQSVFVRQSIKGLIQEGVTGGFFCVLVILLFLGQWKMTAIAGHDAARSRSWSRSPACYATGNTINVMTLAGLTLAIGPMVDSAVICLENTERHLSMGYPPDEAAFLGASQVALPELVSTICTLLVLWPLALTSELGMFLFKPMALGVTFCMIAAYFLSRTLVPACSAAWLKGHEGHAGARWSRGRQRRRRRDETFQIEDGMASRRRGILGRAWARLAGRRRRLLRGIRPDPRRAAPASPGRGRDGGRPPGRRRWSLVYPILRREFYPDVDSGAFEMTVRAPSGTRIENTETRLAEVEDYLRKAIRPEGPASSSSPRSASRPTGRPRSPPTPARWTRSSASSSRPSGAGRRSNTSRSLRDGLTQEPRFADLEFAFDAGGMIHAAMNEGKSTPISVRVTGKDQAGHPPDRLGDPRARRRRSTAWSTPGSSSG